jgi:hypothetical protein
MVLLLTGCSMLGRNEVLTMSNALLATTGQNGRACVRSTDLRGFGTQAGSRIHVTRIQSATIYQGDKQ